MKTADVIIIGAGILGCFVARELAAFDLKISVLEQKEDVCTGISKANTGIIYSGCDTKPGTLKTKFCVAANKEFQFLCHQLGVSYIQCGSLMLGFGKRANTVLQKKLSDGKKNEVPGLEILSRTDILKLEPYVNKNVETALYAPTTGTVEPWELCIAVYENALANGVSFSFSEKVFSISHNNSSYTVHTEHDSWSAPVVVNCAGLSADTVRDTLYTPKIKLLFSGADYIIAENSMNDPINHILFYEPEESSKGITIVPTVSGSLLLGPTDRTPLGMNFETSPAGLEEIQSQFSFLFPDYGPIKPIRSFGSLRPNPYYVREQASSYVLDTRSINSFEILQEGGFFSLIGIKTPGLTCASQIGKYIAGKVAEILHPAWSTCFNPERKRPVCVKDLSFDEWRSLIEIKPEYGRMICQCMHVTEGEILSAIERGARTVNGVKQRTGALLGPCQGGRCEEAIRRYLSSNI